MMGERVIWEDVLGISSSSFRFLDFSSWFEWERPPRATEEGEFFVASSRRLASEAQPQKKDGRQGGESHDARIVD